MYIQNIIQTKTNETGYVPDFGIHKGIVIDVNDPIKGGGRVQVYIPDVHGINLFAFLNANGTANIPTAGGNVGELNIQALEYLKTFCPWASVCSPILTDAGPSTSIDGQFNLVTRNDAEKFQGLTTQFAKPAQSLLPRGNPFAYVTVPSYSQSSSGVYSVPRVGAQVMILFYKGDLNAPVCIGGANGSVQFTQIFALDGSFQNAPNGTSPPTDNTASNVTTNQTLTGVNGTKSLTGGASNPVAEKVEPVQIDGDVIRQPGTEPRLPTPNASGSLNPTVLLLPPLNRAKPKEIE
jgi:phage baseplate assembly protein gpV